MQNRGAAPATAPASRPAIVAAIIIVATALVGALQTGATARTGEREARDAAADETTVLVRYAPGSTEAERRRATSLVNGVERARLLRHIAVVEVGRGERDRAIRALEDDRAVEGAQPDYVMTRDVSTDDTHFEAQWALENRGQVRGIVDSDIDADEAWSVTSGAPAPVVVVIDDGVDYTHPDLTANIWNAPAPSPLVIGACAAGTHGYDTVSHDCDPMPSPGDFHGTHVAGIVGASGNNGAGVAGVNWRTSLLAVRALSGGSGTTSDILEAFDWVVKAKDAGVDVRVVNASWGCMCQKTTVFDSALGELDARGILFVAAAGNSSVDNDASSTPAYPCVSSVPNVVCVAATDAYDRLASFSNYGEATVDVAAPGDWIVSTVPPLSDGTTYIGLSGTSMAAPHVAGVAALVLSTEALGVAALRERLLVSADTVPGLEGVVASGRRLNACRAVGCTPRTDFSPVLHVAPDAISVTAGSSTVLSAEVAATRTSGTMSLGATGVPRGVRVKFEPSSIAAGERSTVTVSVGRAAKRGTTTFTVTATDGSWALSAPVTITIT